MHEFLLDYLPAVAHPYVYKLTAAQWLLVGQVLALVVCVVGLAVLAYCVLRALGWRRFQGSWVSPDQFQAIVQELYTGVKDGRVPDYETMKILDEYVYGSKGSTIRKLNKSDHI